MCLLRSGLMSPETNLDTLVSCSLVRIIEADGTLLMHDELRNLAYSIVRKERWSAVQRTRLLGRDATDALNGKVRPIPCRTAVVLLACVFQHMRRQSVVEILLASCGTAHDAEC